LPLTSTMNRMRPLLVDGSNSTFTWTTNRRAADRQRR
jgi:hypothetical protein